MAEIRYTAPDGRVWVISPGPEGRHDVRIERPQRHLPDWADRLIVGAISRLIGLARWSRWP